MARRSRSRRQAIPGYEENRPNRDDRKRDHRRVRHEAHIRLHSLTDPDELEPLPQVRRDRVHETRDEVPEPNRRRFKVWKTKFWKRRDSYQDYKSDLDARWPVVDESPEEVW